MAKKAEQTTEIAVVENTKLTELAQKSGIELTKAEAHVSSFHPAFAELSELSRPLATLDKENPTADHAKIARETRLKIVKVRTGSESIKDERKKVLLAEGNLIQSAFNLVKDACILTESEYEEIEKHQERVEAQKRAELKSARIELLAPFETDTEFLPLDIMDEEKFQALLAKEKESFEAVTAKRLQDEKDRIAAEKLAEEQRIAEIEAEKVRQAERDAELLELKRLEEERQKAYDTNKKKAELTLLANGYEKGEHGVKHTVVHHFIGANHYSSFGTVDEMIDWTNEIIARDEIAISEKKIKDDALKVAAEKEAELADLRKKQEAAELEAETERQRIIAEQEEKESAAKALLKAPDQEKVKAFFVQFTALQFPELQSEAGKRMEANVKEALAIVKKVIIEDSKTLL